jgi:hypothetical protein
LAKQFQRRRLLEIGQSETIIVSGDHVCQLKNVGPAKIQTVQQKIPECWTYVQQNDWQI